VFFRAIPFAYEIRTFLDWAITPSTLSIYEWLKFEDIYAELFLVKCRLVVEKAEARPFGQVQPLWYVRVFLVVLEANTSR
jgi:hypothetical protein